MFNLLDLLSWFDKHRKYQLRADICYELKCRESTKYLFQKNFYKKTKFTIILYSILIASMKFPRNDSFQFYAFTNGLETLRKLAENSTRYKFLN